MRRWQCLDGLRGVLAVYVMVSHMAPFAPAGASTLTGEAIAERLNRVMIDETKRVLDEGVLKTADDADLTDNTGADLDLHFAHPNASKSNKCAADPKFPCQPDEDGDNAADPWFQSVFDCFWNNANPKWGSTTLNGDDGTLDIDDTNGAGPENASLESPENGSQYWVGVHYWDGHGFPKSTATVNIYIYGVLKGGFTQPVSECVTPSTIMRFTRREFCACS